MPIFCRISGKCQGFDPNVSTILEAPDAVIQWIYDPKIIEPLERVGLTVVGWDMLYRTGLDYLTQRLYDRNDRAQEIIGLQADALAVLQEKIAKLGEVSVLHIDQVMIRSG